MAFASRRIVQRAAAAVANARGAATAAANPEAEVFASAAEHVAYLAERAALPDGFKVSTASFPFNPVEMPGKKTRMSLTGIVLDEPTDSFAGVFTSNAFPGHPVKVGRRRLAEDVMGAIVINNKISNVGAPGGEADAEVVCEEVSRVLGLEGAGSVVPCSTGIIGWRLPVQDMVEAVPALVDDLQGDSALPLAMGIMTTDMFPKLRSVTLPSAAPGAPPVRVVGVAKGAGMVEPNLATMLVYILTDADVSREHLREALPRAANHTFNCLSIDGDQSTSDTLLAAASRRRQLPGSNDEERHAAFDAALLDVCRTLAMDVVRNGEGVRHVMRVTVTGSPSWDLARSVGKHIVNSMLVKTAVAGNDPNVGRLIMAVGNALADGTTPADEVQRIVEGMRISLGGAELFHGGKFLLDSEKEKAVHDHLVEATLWPSVPQITSAPVPVDTAAEGEDKPPAWFVRGESVAFKVPVDYPPHQKCVEIEVDLAGGTHECVVLGNDLTHEYVSINADYRS